MIGGVYYAIRVISHIKAIRAVGKKYSAALAADQTPEDTKIGAQILDVIVQVEKSPIEKLEVGVAAEYIRALSILLQELVKERLKYDVTRGPSLLAELRQTHAMQM